MNARPNAGIAERIASEFLAPVYSVHRTIRKAPHCYKVYEIPKRSGGTRTIAQPSKAIKRLQRWLVSEVIEALPIHAAATAYVKGKCTVDNAMVHAKNPFLLKMDFREFFTSIRESDLLGVLREHEAWDEIDLSLIGRIAFRATPGYSERRLSIGAPSSPSIANVVLHRLDSILSGLCDKSAVNYTRYADDLTFSANSSQVLVEICRSVRRIVAEQESPRLELNESKTRRFSKKHRRTVTGLVITNEGRVGLGRKERRRVDSMIHRVRMGVTTDLIEVRKISGFLAYANMVEPDFVARMEAKHGKTTLDLIKQAQRYRPNTQA